MGEPTKIAQDLGRNRVRPGQSCGTALSPVRPERHHPNHLQAEPGADDRAADRDDRLMHQASDDRDERPAEATEHVLPVMDEVLLERIHAAPPFLTIVGASPAGGVPTSGLALIWEFS
jgi:hypothetical protein